MARPHPNDPCSCGSGRRFKRCCMRLVVVGEPHWVGGEEGRDAGPLWLADAAPLVIELDEVENTRPVLLLVVADGTPIYHEIPDPLGGEPETVARALANCVRRAANVVGRYPEHLIVRHEEIARVLASLPGFDFIEVHVEASPPAIERQVRETMRAFSCEEVWPPVGRSETWAGWVLPPEVVADVFDAAADFYAAAPWRLISNAQALTATAPSGREWTVPVYGRDGEMYGVGLYSDRSDLLAYVTGRLPPDSMDGLRGRLVSLGYRNVSGLSAQARAEIAEHRWRLAGPSACPCPVTVNTPAGGMSHADAGDLVALLRAIPRFVEAHAAEFEAEWAELPHEPLHEWDEAFEVTISYREGLWNDVDDESWSGALGTGEQPGG